MVNQKEISVILPTYNESGNIIELIDRILFVTGNKSIKCEVVVVDDNSPDGTAERVRKYFCAIGDVKLIVRNRERGLATAIKRGILEASKDIVVVMDTDFNHNPEKIAMMVKYLEDFDIVIGSRYVGGGGMKGPRIRYWGSYLFNAFIKLMLGVRTNDNLSGFFASRKSLFSEIPMDIVFQGYGDYFIRLLYFINKNNFSILEIPVVYEERFSGESKTNFLRHLVNYTVTVFKLFIGKLR